MKSKRWTNENDRQLLRCYLIVGNLKDDWKKNTISNIEKYKVKTYDSIKYGTV